MHGSSSRQKRSQRQPVQRLAAAATTRTTTRTQHTTAMQRIQQPTGPRRQSMQQSIDQRMQMPAMRAWVRMQQRTPTAAYHPLPAGRWRLRLLLLPAVQRCLSRPSSSSRSPLHPQLETSLPGQPWVLHSNSSSHGQRQRRGMSGDAAAAVACQPCPHSSSSALRHVAAALRARPAHTQLTRSAVCSSTELGAVTATRSHLCRRSSRIRSSTSWSATAVASRQWRSQLL